MANHIVTKESLQAMLEAADDAKKAKIIGRALVVLFKRQTEGEKSSNTTDVNNSIGFTGADGRSGCLSAKYFLKHGTLADWQVERWMRPAKSGSPRIAKYWRQLDEAAQTKAAQQQQQELVA